MRRAFIEQLVELAEVDSRVLLLSMDLGYCVVEPFQQRFPGRFWNTGVTEQSTMAVAAGLAEDGFLPFVYSIATFATARPYEFIRNGAALHRFPVRIVGAGGGFEYGVGGPTHHACDDIGLMRLAQVATILAPADHRQARACLRATWNAPGPVYYRVGKDEKYEVPGLEGRFEVGKCQQVADGGDVCLVALGSSARAAEEAARDLAAAGIRAAVLVLACVQPPPKAELSAWFTRVPLLVTVESHTAAGGIGESIAAWAAEQHSRCRISRLCVREPWDGVGGSEAFMLNRCGLSAPAIARHVRELLAEGA
jgi:transketolase